MKNLVEVLKATLAFEAAEEKLDKVCSAVRKEQVEKADLKLLHRISEAMEGTESDLDSYNDIERLIFDELENRENTRIVVKQSDGRCRLEDWGYKAKRGEKIVGELNED